MRVCRWIVLPMIVSLGILCHAQVPFYSEPLWCNTAPFNKDAWSPNSTFPNVVASRQQAHKAAWKFAPLYHFHPLEQYYPADATDFLKQATLYDAKQNNLGPVSETELLRLSALHPDETKFTFMTIDEKHPDRSGSAFDAQGNSQAPMYYRVYFEEARQTWVYNFWLWYFYNGCSDQQLLFSEQDGDVQVVLKYIACSFAAHEGDWEGMTVEVSADLTEILTLSYSEHSWNWQLNCTRGDCDKVLINDDGIVRPRAFAALNSHASYPFESLSTILFQIQVPEIANLMAISLADRPLSDPYRRWKPQPNNKNLISLEEQQTPTNATYLYEARISNTSIPDWTSGPTWRVYTGRWGVSYQPYLLRLTSLTCLSLNETRFVDCPNNALLDLAKNLLGSSSSLDKFTRRILSKILADFDPFGPDGPRQKGYYTRWDRAAPTPYWKAHGNSTPVCPDPNIVVSTYTGVPETPVSQTGWGLAISVCAAAGIVCVVFMCISVLGGRLKKKHLLESRAKLIHCTTSDEQRPASPDNDEKVGEASVLSTQARSPLLRHTSMGREMHEYDELDEKLTVRSVLRTLNRSIPRLNLVAIIFTVGGGISEAQGLHDVFALLQRYLPSEYWSSVQRLYYVWSPWILVFSVLALTTSFFIHGKAFEYFCLHHAATMHDFMANWGWRLEWFIILGLFLSAILSLAFVSFGAVVYTVYTAFITVCDRSTKKVDGICLNLEDFGWDTVYCGDDIVYFCNSWRGIHGLEIFIGATLVHIGQIFFLMAAAKQLHRLKKFQEYHESHKEDPEDEGDTFENSTSIQYGPVVAILPSHSSPSFRHSPAPVYSPLPPLEASPSHTSSPYQPPPPTHSDVRESVSASTHHRRTSLVHRVVSIHKRTPQSRRDSASSLDEFEIEQHNSRPSSRRASRHNSRPSSVQPSPLIVASDASPPPRRPSVQESPGHAPIFILGGEKGPGTHERGRSSHASFAQFPPLEESPRSATSRTSRQHSQPAEPAEP